MEVQTMLFVRCFAILIVVILSWATGQTVTVPHATANGPATGGTDYQSKSGTLTFNPGETSKPITVMVTDDTLDEANETFFVNRSTTTNATIADNQGLGTILNYDGVPTLISGKVKSIGTGRGLYALFWLINQIPILSPPRLILIPHQASIPLPFPLATTVSMSAPSGTSR